MSRHHETNPHFLPRQRGPVVDFPSKTPPPRSRLPPRHHDRISVAPPPNTRPQVEVPHHYPVEPPPHVRASLEVPQPHDRTPIEPPPHGLTSPHPLEHVKPVAPFQVDVPHHAQPDSHTRPPQHGRHHPAFIFSPSLQLTRPVAWLIAAFCMFFWILVLVGGMIALIMYLVFQPRNPLFDISSVTVNAAYLDKGYLLNADVTVLANFSNPNSKVKVEFNYVILDLYYDNIFIAKCYIEPFLVMRGESRFSDVHMVASQVGMSRAHTIQLQKQLEQGRMNLEIKGVLRTSSKLGGIFKYSYSLYVHCQLVVAAPPAGVLIGKKCVLKS